MKNVILIVCVLAFFYSCKKDNSPESTNSEKSAYLPMAIGNYWVYQTVTIDSAGNETLSATLDSTVITKDTLIGGETYYKFENYQNNVMNEPAFYRDSSKNLITSDGKILFSESNFTDTLYRKVYTSINNDTVALMTCKMEALETEFVVPSGTYSNVLNLQGTVIWNPDYSNAENPGYNDNIYAKNVGKIFNTYLYSSGDRVEKRLVKYKIN